MSGWQLPALIGAVAAGVLLPKAVPAALVARRASGGVERFLGLLPAALLGALAMSGTLGGGPGWRPRPAVVLAVVAAGTIAAVTRRSLLAMAAGWAVLAAVLLLFG
jgi:branched-subunit amino acid transport protein